MKNISNKAKRLLAVTLALVMVMGACFTGVISASATGVDVSTLTGNVDTVVTADSFGTHNSAQNYITNTGYGIHYERAGSSAYSPAPLLASMGAWGNGFKLQFANYDRLNTNGDYGQFLITIGSGVNHSNYLFWRTLTATTGHLGIVIDTVNGRLLFKKSYAQDNNTDYCDTYVLAESDALLYDNFKEKAFSVEFKPNYTGVGNMNVVVDVEGTKVTGALDYSVMQAPSHDVSMLYPSTNTFISFSALKNDNSGCAVDFIGYSLGFRGDYVDNVDTLATTDMNAYTASKNLVTGGTRYFASNIAYGVHLDSTPWGQGGYYPYALNANMGGFPGNGVTLQFAHFNGTDDNGKRFAIGLSDRQVTSKADVFAIRAGESSAKISRAALVINTLDGKVQLWKNNGIDDAVTNPGSQTEISQDNIIVDNALLYENFAGKPFSVTFTNGATGDIDVEIDINGTVLNGSISKSILATAPVGDISAGGYHYPSNTTNCYFDFGTPTRFGNYTVDFIGYKLLPKVSSYANEIATYISSTDNKLKETVDAPNINYCSVDDITGGGVRLTSLHNSGYHPFVYKTNLGGFANPFTLYFDNYFDSSDTTALGYRKFFVALSKNIDRDTDYKFKTGVAGVLLDTDTGEVYLAISENDNMQEASSMLLGQDNALLYSNISGKEFTYTFARQANGNIGLTINVDGIPVPTFTIPYATFSTYEKFATLSSCFVSISSGLNDNYSRMSFEFIGYRHVPTDKLDGLDTIASASDNLLSNTGRNRVSQVTSGGVTLDFNTLTGYYPYQFSKNMGAFPGNGITLRFGEYASYNDPEAEAEGDKKIFFILGNTTVGDPLKPKSGSPCILLDTNTGDLKLQSPVDDGWSGFNDVQTIISDNNLLKYANITGKVFDLTFEPSGDDILVTVTVGNQSASGTLLASNLYSSQFLTPPKSNTYISVGGIDNNSNNPNNYWGISFYGYSAVMTADDTSIGGGYNYRNVRNAIIDDVPDTVTLSDAAAIYNVAAMFYKLSEADQERIAEEYVTKLTNALTTIAALQAAQNYKPYSTYLASGTKNDSNYPNGYSRSTYSAATDDGFRITWERARNSDVYKSITAQTLQGVFTLDGLRLGFSDFAYTYQSEMFITFTSGDIGDGWSADAANRAFALMLGREDGRLMLYTAGNEQGLVIGTSELLKRENLADKDITMQFIKNGSDYDLFITVDGKVIGFKIKATVLAAATNLDVDNVRVVLSTSDVGNAFAITCNAIYSTNESAVQNVIDAIASVSASNYSTVRAAFNALTNAQNERVVNAQLLADMRKSVRSIGQDGKDTDGYYVPVASDVNRQVGTSNEVIYAYAVNNGGLRFDFTNAVFGMRNSLKDRYVTEDVTLRFDNYNPGNGNGFIIGMDAGRTAENDDSSWNKLASTGRFGLYLLLKDGRLYASKPYQANTMDLIAESAKLKDEYLQNREFTFNYAVDKDPRSIVLTVKVEGVQVASYTFNSTYCASMDQFFIRPDEAQFIIQAAGGYDADSTGEPTREAFTVDLTGIKFKPVSDAVQDEIDAVIAAINALPNNATLSDKADINAAWNAYFLLKTKVARSLVTNFNKLLALHDQIFALEAGTEYTYSQDVIAYNGIDNSKLVAAYKPDSQLTVDENGWPEYTKDLVMAEVCISSATEAGTFQAMEPVLAHLAETGVNGLWIMPVEDRGTDTLSPYCNFGPNTISPYMTGQLEKGEAYDPAKVDYEAGKAVMAEFIDLAHSYNIRVFVDKVPWGVAKSAPIYTQHPEWFKGDSGWGGYDFVTNNSAERTALLNWYKSEVVDFMLDTGADGIRWDLEPNYFGYDFVKSVLTELRNNGKKPVFFSEDKNNRTDDAFAFEQVYGVVGKDTSSQTFGDVFFNDTDITYAIKNGTNNIVNNGTSRYIAYQMSSHDVFSYTHASLATWAYSFTMSPFIPLFNAGEEYSTSAGGLMGWTYDANEVNTNRSYYESVKKLIQIRYQYKDIIINNASQIKNTNICAVSVKGTDLVQGYARYSGSQAIVVVTNVNDDGLAADFTVNLPLADMGLSGYSKFTVTDLMNGDMIASGTADEIKTFTQNIAHDNAGVYLVSGVANNFTWDLDGTTLTISGNGAIDTAAWLAAATQATTVIVENGVTTLPAGAFANFGKLETITLPASVNTIGANAFANINDNAKLIAPKGSYALTYAQGVIANREYSEIVDTTNNITFTMKDGSGFADGTDINVALATAQQTAAKFGALNATMYDITMLYNSVATQPESAVTVKLPVPAGYDTDLIKVFYVPATGNPEELTSIIANNMIYFDAEHFSNYAVVEYIDRYEGEFKLDSLVYNATTGGLVARVPAAYVNLVQAPQVTFAENGNTVVTEYTVNGEFIEFAYTAKAADAVTATLSATTAGEAITADAVSINLARFEDETGLFVVYGTLPCGDVNGDESINVKDLARLKKVVAGTVDETEAADITTDGSVVAGDLVALAKLMLVGKKGMRAYTVTFKNSDNSVIASLAILEGFAAHIADAVMPGKVFSNWSASFDNVTADIEIVAVYVSDSTETQTDPAWGYDD